MKRFEKKKPQTKNLRWLRKKILNKNKKMKDQQNKQPPETEQMANFALDVSFERLPKDIVDQLKRHLLDALGSFVFALNEPTPAKLIRQIAGLSEGGACTAPKIGACALDRAAELYTALIRYPDFMDNYMGKEATCHPSDNIGALLAIGQAKRLNGKDFLTAMAIGYEIECRLIDEIPVMIKGFDHTTLFAYSVTSAIGFLLSLDKKQLSHALAIAGATYNPLAVSRASYTSEWKGFTSSMVTFGCVNIALLAEQGMTGPLTIFEGPKGYKEVFGMELTYDWTKEDFSLIRKCVLKEYVAEVHTQTALEILSDLKKEHGFSADKVDSVDITTFLTAYHITGGGEYGDRKEVRTKEQADHSFPYLAAVLLLDGKIYPEQVAEARIMQNDVQSLMKKITVKTAFPLHKPVKVAGMLDPYTQAYPDKMFSKVEITLADGQKISKEKEDFHGFFTRPFTWEDCEKKFRILAKGAMPANRQDALISIIKDLENKDVSELIETLCL
jgi:2-methylcitrate dehydratase